MPNESSTLPVLPRFGDPDSWAANVATKQDVADAKLAATTGSTTQTSITISGTGGSGFVALPTQSSSPAAPATGVALFANATGKFSWRNAADTYSRSFEVTATADRVFTIPDASFTFAGQNLANTFTLANTFSANGALSAPAVSFTGTPIAGGTATTTKPMVLVETAGATSTGWSTSGTLFGVNSTGGSLLLFDFQSNGSSRLALSSGGNLVQAGSGALQWLSRGILTSPAAGQIQLGNADAASPVAQMLSVQSVVAGTTDTAGANFTQKMSAGTGTGAGGSWILQTAPAALSTASTQNAFVTQLTVPSAGGLQFGSSGVNAAYIFPFSGSIATSVTPSGRGLSFFSYVAATAGDDSFVFTGNANISTSSTHNHVRITKSFNPTSGTAVYNHLTLAPTINQTGGANGVTRAIYISPTLTAAADFRALEITAGKTIFATSGALSEPAVSFTGTPITGGTSTTTKPLVLIETSGATSAGWDTNGSYLGINQSSGFSGYALDIQKNGSRVFSVYNSGTTAVSGDLRLGSASVVQWNLDAIITRKAAANLQFGAADAAAPVAQTLSVQSVVAGTTDTAGVNFTIKASAGTGTGAGGSIIFQVAPAGSSGSSQNAYTTILTLSGASQTATFGGAVTSGGSIQIPAASAFYWNARSIVRSPADSVITLANSAETSFDRLQFGGTTSSFPAIKRSTTTLQAVLADDSGFAAVQSLYDRFGSGTPEGSVTAPVGAVYHRTDGGAGTSFYVKESGTGNTGWVAK